MGHYDDIRERHYEEERKTYRQRELVNSCDELRRELEMIGGGENTVGELLRLKFMASEKADNLSRAVSRADIVFQALLNAGELKIERK